MRILYLTEYWPWPTNSGSRLRGDANVRALATLGTVDIVYVNRGWPKQVPDEPCPLDGDCITITADPLATETPADWTYPTAVAEVSRAFGEQIRRWVRGRHYDLVWSNRLTTWAPLREVVRVPMVVDLDDLADRISMQFYRDTGDEAHLVDAKQWRQLVREAAQQVDCLVVCSTLDRQRLGEPANSSVVPNVYLGSAEVEPLPSDDPSPRILLQGLFDWSPNVDAAQRLVREILPAVREEFPRACVWLVGMHVGLLDNLAEDGVRVVGQVPDVRPYVRAADVVAVPLRQGSGTRLKLLESFFHGTPVVSTTLGAEGIRVRNREHLLIADSSQHFADEVRAVLRDPLAAARMACRAREIVVREYGWEILVDSVTQAVERAQAAFARRPAVESS